MKGDPSYTRPWIRNQSSRYLLLNGDWKFHWVKQPSERPVDFYKPGYDVSAWKEIPVPSNWEMLGYGTPSIPISPIRYATIRPLYRDREDIR